MIRLEEAVPGVVVGAEEVGDRVLTQTEVVYDGVGNALATTTCDRFDKATGTGALGTPTSGLPARVSFNAGYYDMSNRPIASVDVGTNGGSNWTRPSSVPTGSGTVLVSSETYDSAGQVFDATDPLGLVNRTYYDALGRTTKTIQDYTDGVVTNASNKTTTYAYN